MWTLIGRFAMGIFLPEDSTCFVMRLFVKPTDPLSGPFVAIYVAWFFFMFRFYLMPWLMGYSVIGMLSFALESEIALNVATIVGFFMR